MTIGRGHRYWRGTVHESACRYAIESALCVLMFQLTGCAGMREFIADTYNVKGARQTLSDTSAAKVDLFAALTQARNIDDGLTIPVVKTETPSNTGSQDCRTMTTSASSNEPDRRRCLAVAYRAFNVTYPSSSVAGIAARNSVQEQLVSASELSCSIFKQNLNYVQSTTNFGFGAVTTALAGAAAIVTPTSVANALAGGAAVTSGVRAEFNADLFFQQAAPTLTKAVDTKRALFREDLRMSKQRLPLAQYPVEAAVSDAIAYNDLCSLTSALQFISDAVNLNSILLQDDPGTMKLGRLLKGANDLRMDASNLRATSLAPINGGAVVRTLSGRSISLGDDLNAQFILALSQQQIKEEAAQLKQQLTRFEITLPTNTTAAQVTAAEDQVGKASDSTITAMSAQPNVVLAGTLVTEHDLLVQKMRLETDALAAERLLADFAVQQVKVKGLKQDLDDIKLTSFDKVLVGVKASIVGWSKQ